MYEHQTDIDNGLSNEQVKERIEKGQVNKTKLVVGKSYGRIIYDNLFSFFNILLYIIFGIMLFGNIELGRFILSGCFFMFILLGNVVIGLYEDIKARRLMGKMHLINAPKAKVIRGGELIVIKTEEVVLDDLVKYQQNDQITSDGIVVKGFVLVNESLLTGEPDNIIKNVGDKVLSGSYITGGEAYIRVTAVGKDSYVEKIQNEGNKFKRSQSQILKSLKTLFKVIGVGVIAMAVATTIIYFVQGRFNSIKSFAELIPSLGGCFVSMIPSGLYLLTSVTLAVAVIALAKKKANVQDFYSVEMLARTDVLCLDKTGTITDGNLSLKKIIPLNEASEKDITSIISNIVNYTKDNNATAKALNSLAQKINDEEPIATLPFNSENKFSGISYKKVTYLLGAPDFVHCKYVVKEINEYTSKGYRVLLLVKSNQLIKDNHFEGTSEPLAVIVLQDHIKESAFDTFKWFKENKVDIKIISGDDAITVSEIAKQVGIETFDRYISLTGLSEDETKKAATEYTIFGRVSPEQKKWLVEALQEAKHTVAMTGDGVNDILALKKADCSIAMASGSEATRNISHIVLMDSDFASLPAVVGEGRRVVNNLQRTCSLFLVKTIFSFLTCFIFLLISLIRKDPSVSYPYLTNHMYLWECFNLGVAAFFISLQPNKELLHGNFLKNILFNAIPAGFALVLGEIIIFLGYYLNVNGICHTGIISFDIARNISVLMMTCVSYIVLVKVCLPLDKIRTIILIGAGVCDISVLLFTYFAIDDPSSPLNILKLNMRSLGPSNYLYLAVVVIMISALYLTVTYIIDLQRKKEQK